VTEFDEIGALAVSGNLVCPYSKLRIAEKP
jgi:hypothetical protein